jgi:hypothetical protein
MTLEQLKENNWSPYLSIDAPEKLAQALKIAVEALEKMRMNSDPAGVAKYSLEQIDEVLK